MKKIKIRIQRQRLEVLLDVYVWIFTSYNPETPYEWLLYHIAGELHGQAAKQLHNESQERFTVLFTEVQALGFYQLFNNVDLRNMAFANVVVSEIIGAIDKVHKNAERRK